MLVAQTLYLGSLPIVYSLLRFVKRLTIVRDFCRTMDNWMRAADAKVNLHGEGGFVARIVDTMVWRRILQGDDDDVEDGVINLAMIMMMMMMINVIFCAGRSCQCQSGCPQTPSSLTPASAGRRHLKAQRQFLNVIWFPLHLLRVTQDCHYILPSNLCKPRLLTRNVWFANRTQCKTNIWLV